MNAQYDADDVAVDCVTCADSPGLNIDLWIFSFNQKTQDGGGKCVVRSALNAPRCVYVREAWCKARQIQSPLLRQETGADGSATVGSNPSGWKTFLMYFLYRNSDFAD